ncbi:hypothetical protein PGKDCPLP_02716 [Stenotrophomonas maltophilia]|nr:hypothetical protein PGKDCPLP_02716 [Stenotrophomonas maltophilia]
MCLCHRLQLAIAGRGVQRAPRLIASGRGHLQRQCHLTTGRVRRGLSTEAGSRPCHRKGDLAIAQHTVGLGEHLQFPQPLHAADIGRDPHLRAQAAIGGAQQPLRPAAAIRCDQQGFTAQPTTTRCQLRGGGAVFQQACLQLHVAAGQHLRLVGLHLKA